MSSYVGLSDNQLRLWQDGEFRDGGFWAIRADDPALGAGVAVYETLRTYSRSPFCLDAHLRRMAAGADRLGLRWPGEAGFRAGVEAVVGAAAEDTSGLDVVVRMMLTGGGHRLVWAGPLPRRPSAVRCVTQRWVRSVWLPSDVKHTARLEGRRACAASGADEVLWVDDHGCLLEGTRSNVFAVIGDVLVTPPSDGRILAGVTRAELLAAAHSLGLPAREGVVAVSEPYSELYLSSSLMELVPVVELDGEFAPGAGPVGRTVYHEFRRRTGMT